MKCVNCNKEIPDTSVICPYCNTKVDPVVTATPEFNVPEDASSAPVITNKDGLVVNNSPMQAAPGMEEVAPVDVSLPETPTEPQLPSDQNNLVVETAAQPIITDEMVNEAAPAVPEGPAVEAPTMVPEETNGVIKPVAPATEESVPTLDTTSTVGEVTEDEPKKKSPVGKIFLIIGLVIAALVALGGVYFYFTEFKSADKRMSALTQSLFKAPLIKDIDELSNASVELSSGKYELTLDVDYDNNKIKGAVEGSYGIDTKNKLADFTLNVKEANVGGQELINSKNPLNIELYSTEDRIYVLLENFFNKYIYVTSSEIGSIYDAIEQNDFDYASMIKAFETALADGIDATAKSQDIKKVTFGGKQYNANVVTVKFDTANVNKFSKAAISSLKNNKKFISQYAKLTGISEAEAKDSIKLTEDIKVDNPTTLELYTGVLTHELIGVKYTNSESKSVLEIKKVGDNIKLEAYQDSTKVFSMDITEAIEKTAKTVTHSGSFEGTVYLNETTFTIKLTYKFIKDVNPSVKKVDVTNSVALENLTQEDLTNILNKVYDYGLLGQLAKQYTTPYMTTGSYSSYNPYGGYTSYGTTGIDNCSPGMNCSYSQYKSLIEDI